MPPPIMRRTGCVRALWPLGAGASAATRPRAAAGWRAEARASPLSSSRLAAVRRMVRASSSLRPPLPAARRRAQAQPPLQIVVELADGDAGHDGRSLGDPQPNL